MQPAIPPAMANYLGRQARIADRLGKDAYNPNMSLGPGTRLGTYEIVSLLGAGGMGEVYLAHDARLGRDVAVKVLPAAYATDPDRVRRFEQEARAAAALNHPNILAVYDIGVHDEAPFIVSEQLAGV